MKNAHDEFGGLTRDLLLIEANRRDALRWFVGAAMIPIVGCGSNTATDAGTATEVATTTDTPTGTDAGSGTCGVIPPETAGPYPGDGTNGPNVLSATGVVRRDLRSSFAGMTGTAEGVPLTVVLRLKNTNGSCAALSGLAVYLWHADRQGRYSLYSAGVTDQNYLRGVQISEADGAVTFTTIVPGCYDGRFPHIHFEVFANAAMATQGRAAIATSQLALPVDLCNAAYAVAGYETSVTNFARTTLATDNVFRDGATLQLASASGSIAAGYTVTLDVGVAR
jgi:protocatechuate 3,4-dioxygenase beta subunit